MCIRDRYNIQLASLFSVKTGGCEENCSYCSQSIYSASEIKSHPQYQVEKVLARAQVAKNEGADRFCMGWAWREIRDGKSFNAMLEMVSGVRDAGINVCCGGIIGLGETNGDRASLLEVLSNMNPHPESVPINSLVAIEGTGLELSLIHISEPTRPY